MGSFMDDLRRIEDLIRVTTDWSRFDTLCLEWCGRRGLIPVLEPEHLSPAKTVVLDLDGVVHAYHKGWHGGVLYDVPVDGAVEGIEQLRARGYRVIIFTARDNLNAVQAWLGQYGIEVDGVTNYKPVGFVYVDDRALRFDTWIGLVGRIGFIDRRHHMGHKPGE